jgi:hypothetical protein
VSALTWFTKCGESARLHGEQARLQFGLWRAALKRLSATLGEPDRLLGLIKMVRQVTYAGEYVCTELTVITNLREVKGAVEVLPGAFIPASVMRHPTGHLGQGCCPVEEELSIAALVTTEEPWRYFAVQVADHGRVKVSATDLPIGCSKGVHD